jgi:hypothetical protein
MGTYGKAPLKLRQSTAGIRVQRRGTIRRLGIDGSKASQVFSRAFRDAANVIWKIHKAVRGHADEELLDTYRSDREPHHDAMTSRGISSQLLNALIAFSARYLVVRPDRYVYQATERCGEHRGTAPVLLRGCCPLTPSTSSGESQR